MGSRITFIRSKIEKVPAYIENKRRLFDDAFEPEIRDPAAVNRSEKSIEGILFLLNGQPVQNAEAGIVSQWKFKPLTKDSEGIIAYYIEPLQVNELNRKLSQIDASFLEMHYDPQKMIANKIYPDIWDEEQGYNGLVYLKDHFATLQKFVADAASNGQVVIAIPT